MTGGFMIGTALPAHAADMDAQLAGLQIDTTSIYGLNFGPYTSGETVTVQADQVFWFEITMRNTGSDTWGWRDPWLPVSYLTRSPDYNTTFGTFFIGNAHAGPIETGDTMTVRSGLRAPDTPGTYSVTWQPANWLPSDNDWTKSTFFGATATLTLNVVARTDTPPAAQTHTEGVLDASNFQYVGSFMLPEVPVPVPNDGGYNDEKTYFNSGLTLRTVDGQQRLLMETGTYHESLYEVAIPPLVKIEGSDLSDVPTAKLTNYFGPIPMDEGANTTGGIYYDQASDQLYWTNYIYYTAQNPTSNPILNAGKIDSGQLVQTSYWYEPSTRTSPQAAFWGGMTSIPQDFANQYTDGKTLALGFGGNNNPATSSAGPALAAVDVSSPSGSTMVEQPLFYHIDQYRNTEGMSTRPGNYFMSGTDDFHPQPSSPWQGYWALVDSIGSGLFIDLPGQQGYLTFAHQGINRVGYDGGGASWNTQYQNTWYFYDYQTLGDAITGVNAAGDKVSPWDITPTSMTAMTLPNTATSADQQIAGSAFDPTTRLLYVYSMRAVGQTGCCSKPPMVHVYYVLPDLASLAVTTPPTVTSYTQGDTLNLSGMTVTATYSDGSTKDVTNDVTTSPANGTTLNTVGAQTVQVSYTDNEITKTASIPITVVPKPSAASLSSIAMTTLPNALTYKVGDKLSLAGMVVTATYSDGSTKDVTANVTTNPKAGTTMSPAGTYTVTVSYAEGGVTKTTSFTVTSSNKPAVSSDSSLASLKVPQAKPQLTPDFNPMVTNYSVAVPNSVSNINVVAQANNSTASVSGTGQYNLKVGTTGIKIKVTAADGSSTTYTITATRATT